MTLSAKERAFLQGLLHDTKPVVLVGHKGITDALAKETAQALLAHELIKVRLAAATDEDANLDDDAADLAQRTGAELVARVGRMAMLYKRHPHKPKIELPKPKKKKKGLFDVVDD